jgi:hypothetical protein
MQHLVTVDVEGLDHDKSQRVEEMLKQLQSEYLNISRQTEDDSLFDPESVCILFQQRN